ncbi:MAG: ADP-ribosylglycohydrolase family protein [Armatimonadota bacterium]
MPDFASTDQRLQRARQSLEGLSVGDAFGDRYFTLSDTSAGPLRSLIARRAELAAPWWYTDDTEMALSVYAVLAECGGIDPDRLAWSFAERYDPGRGYGAAMHGLLADIRQGQPWQGAASALFGGQGSYGNGAAMRVAPLGAYFADDLDAVVEHAARSAAVTHSHPEGIAGAVAVALAAAWAARSREAGERPSRRELLERVRERTPDSEVREKLRHAWSLEPGCSVELAAMALGNGSRISAQDTVPFCLWSAGERLDHYEEALWLTVSALGDRDTTCAIVGGIVAAYTGAEAIPERWLRKREPLPDWPFESSSRPGSP